jgi:hypothetical protein
VNQCPHWLARVTTDAWGTIIASDEQQATVPHGRGRLRPLRRTRRMRWQPCWQLFCSTPRTFRIPNAEHRSVGERVRISIVDGSVGRSALYAYVFPLLALLPGPCRGRLLATRLAQLAALLPGCWSAGWDCGGAAAQPARPAAGNLRSGLDIPRQVPTFRSVFAVPPFNDTQEAFAAMKQLLVAFFFTCCSRCRRKPTEPGTP